MFNDADSHLPSVELSTRAFLGGEVNSQNMNVFVEIELKLKDGQPFVIVTTPAQAIHMAMRILATAHMTVADAYMIDAMHKLKVEDSLVSKIINFVRMKRSAGEG